MFADLHLHTRHSDGTYTAGELVAAARHQGLGIIALTDHDTLDGCAEVARLAAAANIGFVVGTEVTAELEGRELHVLGYLVDPTNLELAQELAKAQAIRQNRVREMVERLNSRDIPLAVDAVFTLANCRAPGRPHVARALVEAGFCANLDEAFDRYLKKDRPGWVPKKKISAARAMELIHGAGGIAVIAHPGLNHDDRLIGKLAALGLDGVECHHPKHTASAAARYEAMARELGLLITGGSDCHGSSKGKPTIGTVKVPGELVEALRNRHKQRSTGSFTPSESKSAPAAHTA